MNAAAAQSRARHRGAALLLAHCEALDDSPQDPRPKPVELLAERVGGELAELLVSSLARSQPPRGRELGA